MYQTLLAILALSIPIIGMIVAVRLIWCVYQSLRASHIKFAAFSVVAIVLLAGLFVAVALVWFGYGLAHSKKDIESDLKVFLLTGLPFYAASFACWHLAKYFQSVLRQHGAQSGAVADAPQAAHAERRR